MGKIKIVFFVCTTAITFLGCNNKSNPPSQSPPEQSDSGIYYPYSPIYSNGFKTGNYKYLKIVTEIWKEIENGDITRKASDFADSLTMVYPDQVLNGKRDSILRIVKRTRDKYLAVQSFIYSWMPARAKDHDDDWVFIWGRQEVTDKAGKLKIAEVHEIWQFNQQGKIMQMQQYISRASYLSGQSKSLF